MTHGRVAASEIPCGPLDAQHHALVTKQRRPLRGQLPFARTKTDVTKKLNAMSDIVERVGIHQSIQEIVEESDSIIVSK